MRTRMLAVALVLAGGVNQASAQYEPVPQYPMWTDPSLMVQPVIQPVSGYPAAPLGAGYATVGAPLTPMVAGPIDYAAAPSCPAPSCEQPQRFFLEAEYLLMFVDDAPVPFPLVTQGTPAGNPNFNGVSVLFGGRDEEFDLFSGGRIRGGVALGAQGQWRLEGNAFYLPEDETVYSIRSDATGNPLLVRPVVNSTDNLLAGLSISLPNFASGGVTIRNTAEIWGGETSLVRVLKGGPGGYLATLVGFKYLDILERLSIAQSTDLLPGTSNPFSGTTLTGPANLAITDTFGTRNQFYGPHVGGQFLVSRGRFLAQLDTRVGLGVMHQVVKVTGSSTATPVGGVGTTVPGGLLAQASNIGRFDRDRFAAVPEVNFRVAYQVTSWLTATAGYNFLYATEVVRPGDQIDPVVAVGQIPTTSAFGTPGASRPGRLFQTDDFFLHGLSAGLTCRY